MVLEGQSQTRINEAEESARESLGFWLRTKARAGNGLPLNPKTVGKCAAAQALSGQLR
jgi:hypothetical protein